MNASSSNQIAENTGNTKSVNEGKFLSFDRISFWGNGVAIGGMFVALVYNVYLVQIAKYEKENIIFSEMMQKNDEYNKLYENISEVEKSLKIKEAMQVWSFNKGGNVEYYYLNHFIERKNFDFNKKNYHLLNGAFGTFLRNMCITTSFGFNDPLYKCDLLNPSMPL